MAWVTPITWSNGAVTAAQMNSLRDNLNWLKSALDLITGGTAADTGTTTNIEIVRTTTDGVAFSAKQSGDDKGRIRIYANGDMAWGGGVGVPNLGLSFGSGGLNLGMPLSGVANPIRMMQKSGPPSDSDIPASYTGPVQGFVIVDTTNHRICVRSGTVWRCAALSIVV